MVRPGPPAHACHCLSSGAPDKIRVCREAIRTVKEQALGNGTEVRHFDFDFVLSLVWHCSGTILQFYTVSSARYHHHPARAGRMPAPVACPRQSHARMPYCSYASPAMILTGPDMTLAGMLWSLYWFLTEAPCGVEG